MFILTIPVFTFAHSGRTDSKGGHRDNNNVSGLGSYHYHHGYPAHLHPNGVCPYELTAGNSQDTTIIPQTPTNSQPDPETSQTSNKEFNIHLYDNDYENLIMRLDLKYRAKYQMQKMPIELPPHDEFFEHELAFFETIGAGPNDSIVVDQDLVRSIFEHGFSTGYLLADIDNFPEIEDANSRIDGLILELGTAELDLKSEKAKTSELEEELTNSYAQNAKLQNEISGWKIISFLSIAALIFIFLNKHFNKKRKSPLQEI